jgi:hypothetical protein
MSLFIDSPAQADAPGAYAVEVPTPSNIDEVSLGYIGFVGQFDWGPMQSVFIPQDAKQLVDTFQPAGSPRTSTGWRAVMKRRGFTAKIVRVLDEDAIKATLSDAGTGGNLVSTAKYFGTLGNSIVRTIAAASGGDTAKRDLTYTLTDPVTGTTSETYKDVAMNSAPDVSKSLLLGSIVFSGGTMTVWPGNGSLNLAAGTNGGSLASIDYTGTAGAADAGVALFETQADVRVLVHDDCGNTMRAAVNAAFEAQCETLRDRIAVLESDPDAASWAAVKAAVTGSLVDGRVIWCGAWVTAADDSGIDRTTPFSSFIATALVNLEPQQSHSWRDPRVLKYFDGITGIVAAFSTASKVIQGEATKTAFICLPILRPRANTLRCTIAPRRARSRPHDALRTSSRSPRCLQWSRTSTGRMSLKRTRKSNRFSMFSLANKSERDVS